MYACRRVINRWRRAYRWSEARLRRGTHPLLGGELRRVLVQCYQSRTLKRIAGFARALRQEAQE